MARLVANVTLRGPAPDYALQFFGPDSGELPAWAAEELADSPHLFTGDTVPTPRTVENPVNPEKTENSETGEKETGDENPTPTPQNNPPSRNKSAATWAAYLKEKGVPTPEGASRETLIDIAERNGLL